jgi:hypothetical protein
VSSVKHLNNYKSMYLMPWALYLVLEIKPTDCHYREFAGLFSKDMSPSFILRMQEIYIHRCKTLSEQWPLDHPDAPPLMPFQVVYPAPDTDSHEPNMEEDEKDPPEDNAMNRQTAEPPNHPNGQEEITGDETMEYDPDKQPPLTAVPLLCSLQHHFHDLMNKPLPEQDIGADTPLKINFHKAYNNWKDTVKTPDTFNPLLQRTILFPWALEHIQHSNNPSLSAEHMVTQWFDHYRGMTFEALLAASSMHLPDHRLNYHLGHSRDLCQPKDYINVPMTPKRANLQVNSLEQTLLKVGLATVKESRHRHYLAQLLWWALHQVPQPNHDAQLTAWFTETPEQLSVTLFTALRTYFGPPPNYELEGDDL